MWSRTREATIPVQQAAKRSSFQEHSRPQSTRCSMRHSPTSAAAIAGASWPSIKDLYIYKDVKTYIYIYIQYMICIIIKSRSWQSGWWCNCNQPPKQSWGRILIHPNPSYKMENIGKHWKTNKNKQWKHQPEPEPWCLLIILGYLGGIFHRLPFCLEDAMSTAPALGSKSWWNPDQHWPGAAVRLAETTAITSRLKTIN